MIIVIALTGISIVFTAVVFNKFIRKRFLMKEALSGIDVQLKRRHDLIPNIVEAVKGYMQYEKDLLIKVTEIRALSFNAADLKKKTIAENELAHALKNIIALTENYPDLKANKSFLDLQQRLVEVEDHLQLARRYYNATVRDNNILIESFPSNIIAALFNFKAADFFEIEYATERKAPDVKF